MVELLLRLAHDQSKAVGSLDDSLGQLTSRVLSDSSLSEEEMEWVQAAAQNPPARMREPDSGVFSPKSHGTAGK